MTRRDLEKPPDHGKYTSSNLRRALVSLERRGHIILQERPTLDQSFLALPPPVEPLSNEVVSQLLAELRARS